MAWIGWASAPAAQAAEPPQARLGPAAVNTVPLTATSFSLTGGPGSLRLDFDTFSARLDLALPRADEPTTSWRRPGWQLFGDYRFMAIGGLRATGGLLGASSAVSNSGLLWPTPTRTGQALGPRIGDGSTRAPLWSPSPDGGTATYLGLGYSLVNRPAGWDLSADIGLVGQRDPGEVRLGRSGAPGADWLRELRLRPLLQVGVTYAF